MKKDLENQIGDINKELENIYLPHDAVLIFLGKRTAFEIALELIDSLQQEQPEVDLEKELEEEIERFYRTDEYRIADTLGRGFETLARHFAEWGAKHLKK